MTSDQNENTKPNPDPTPSEDVAAADAPEESPAEVAPDAAPEETAPIPEPEEPPAEPEELSAEPEATPDPEAAGEGEGEGDQEFSRMLEESAEIPAEATPGDKLTGTIVQVGDHDVFVDCGLRNELPMALTELRDKDGNLQHKEGDEVTGHVQKDGEGLRLTLAIDPRKAGHEILSRAYADGTPIKGKVGDTNKGGFSVDLGGTRAFCPFSQIDLRRADDPTVFVGNEYEFKILELSDDGRNIVVSRRALLQEQREESASATRSNLKLGHACEGVVTRLVPFGAFVDIGGLEGLVHISQISHQRVGHPGDVLKEGQEVKVKVLEIQNLGMGRSERISLSMKALASDPWPETAQSLVPGTDVTGRVTRLVDFGVFVELQPGIEGLVHISELANRRIIHPREVLNEDEEIEIRILDVDLDRRRISLSRRQSANYDED